jgi:hypothetical protein
MTVDVNTAVNGLAGTSYTAETTLDVKAGTFAA